MNLLGLLGIQSRSQGSVDSYGGTSPLAGVLPPARSAVTDVNLDSALSINSVFRAVQILSGAVSQLELGVWRAGIEIDSPAIVRQPDVNKTLSQFLKRTTISLAGTGNAYWLLINNSAGATDSIQILNPLAVSIGEDKQGRKVYHYASETYRTDQVKHLRLLEVPGHEYGLGPVQSCRSGLGSALSLRDYSDNWFSKSAVPTGVLSTDLNLTGPEADAYKARWNEMQAERSVAVLSKGLKYEPILLSPADAQFLESQQFSVTTVAQMFGIPAPYLLAAVQGSSMTYQNLEMADSQFVKYTLMAYLKEIEDALSSVLPRGQVAKFKLDGFLRPDAKSQADIHKIYFDMGVISADEIRADKGWTGPAPQRKPAPAPAPAPENGLPA